MAKGRNYRVGYGKPPPEHRFKKGQSGNPKGRKRNPRTEPEYIAKIRDERIPMVLNGKRVLVSPVEALIRKMFQISLQKGSVRDIERMLFLFLKHGAPPAEDLQAEAERAGEEVVRKLFSILDRTVPDDPEPDDPEPEG